MLPSDKAKLDGSCLGNNITSRSTQWHEKETKETTEKIHTVKEAQFSLKCLEKSTTKKRGFDGDMVVEGADQGTRRNQEAWGGVNRCK